MRQTTKSITLVSLFLLSLFSGMVLGTEQAEASQVVITEAVRVVDGGTASDSQAAVASDSEGNVHIVWARNTQHLYYSMISPRGETLIDATQITNPGLHKVWHPDMVVDDNDRIHLVWADKSGQHKIMYTSINPYLAPLDGMAAEDTAISVIDDTIISMRAQDRDWPSIDVDSQGNLHIAWQDSYDELQRFFNQPQIYYTMIQPEFNGGSVLTLFEDTLLTPIIGHKGHPDIVVDSNDLVQIAWDDTRGGKVELVFVIDTSGSMYSEWADVCTVIYGGSFSGSGSFQGIKPLLEEGNMTVYETIYGLGNTLPGAASSGNCASYNQNAGPRPTALGIVDGDDSGGIRKLPGTVYNGNTYSGYSGEDWGPGTNWACLSWKDSNGNIPGNPPTQDDHKWNPNATKIVIPISDEGPKDGDPSQQADDTTSIEEAHDNCVTAGVVPVGMYGQTYGGATNVQSHFKDLSQCPNGVQSVAARNCPGNTIRSTDAGGQVYEFPSSGANTAQMALLVEAMVYISTNNSREIYMSVLDPYGKMNNDPSWTPGVSGTVTQNGAYIEDTGRGADGHLVVVNDTRVTIDDAYSFHPSIGVDMEGNTHIAWMDGRDYGFEKDVNYEIYYTKLRLQGAGEFDGRDDGLSTYAIKKINDTPISNVETNAGLPPNAPWGGNSVFPSLLTDDQNQIHIAWVDSANTSAGEELLYVRLNHTSLEGDGLTALDPWETVAITSWSSNKLGPNSGYKPSIGMPPAFSNDLGSGAHVAWSDTNKCNDETNNNRFTVCYSHVLTGQVDVEFDDGETFYHVIEPGEQTIYNLTMNNSTPGPKDLVADSYGLNITGVPTNWTATLFFADNHTAIFPDTEIALEGGESIRFYLRVRAPSIYQAGADELAEIRVDAKSYKDPAIRSEITTLTLMDVVHGIDLDASHSVADVEQGQTAIFSITITNTGNVADTFLFWDPQTLEGRQEWLLPFAWDVNFPLSVQLDPQQTVTKNLEINVPTSEDPGAFVILLKGWSAGEPVKSVEKGTYDILELGVFVSIRSSNNIVFNITDQEAMVTPAPYAPNALDPNCHVFEIEVEKYFDTGDLVFTTPGTTENEDNWTTEVIFPNGLSLNPDGVSYPWVLMSGDDYRMHVVKVKICAPDDAPAGLGKAVTIKANLKGYPKISAAKILQVDVDHVYQLKTDVALVVDEQLTVNPGDAIILPTTVSNNGNGPDRFDYTLARVTDSSGVDVIWDITIPRNTLEELDSGSSQTFEVLMGIPQQVPAGDYTVVFHTKSEQKDEDASGRMTRLRDITTLTVTVREFHDMQITMDPTVENDVKTSAPGRVVRFIVNITNAGNVPDVPTLDNHTSIRSGSDITVNEDPGMGTLAGWDVDWRMIRQVGLDLESEEDCVTTLSTAASYPEDSCVYLSDIDEWRLPEMDPYQTYTMVAVVSIDPGAQLLTRSLGLKVVSMMGNAEEGGDHDDSASWVGDLLDSNEKIVTINLRAPDLVVKSASTDVTSADVGESIPIRIEIANTGNVHASDIEVILCEYDDDDMLKEIRKNNNMCDEESIVMRQIIGALDKPDDSQTERVIELYMLYPVTAGSKNVYVVVDPGNTIVEANEGDNIVRISTELGSSNPFLDVAGEVAGKVALPTMIVLLTFSLFGVLYLVGRGRRAAVKDRIAEQSSLMSVLGDEADA